jgi:hypothetical protein
MMINCGCCQGIKTDITPGKEVAVNRSAFTVKTRGPSVCALLVVVSIVVAEEWVAIYNGPGNGRDEAYAIAVDDRGYVYVAGASVGFGTYYDYATIKYNFAGETVWVRRYNYNGRPGNLSDIATAIAVDKNGNVYVTGQSLGYPTEWDFMTIKYDAAGDTVWVRRYNGPGNEDDEAVALAVDNSGNVYVTGRSKGSGTHFDYLTIKYSPQGDEVWVRRYNGPGNGDDFAYAVAVDDSGYVCVTGYSYSEDGYYDYVTIKYPPAGVGIIEERQLSGDRKQEVRLIVEQNPDFDMVRIGYQVVRPGRVSLKVYDASGRLVRVLADGFYEPGFYTANWTGRSGIYLVQLVQEGQILTEKVAVLR